MAHWHSECISPSTINDQWLKWHGARDEVPIKSVGYVA